MHPVQVLVKSVQQEGQQLLRVVLLNAAEPGRVLADRELPAEGGGREVRWWALRSEKGLDGGSEDGNIDNRLLVREWRIIGQ